MELELDLRKSAPQNANEYFNKAKELERKAEKAEKVLKKLKKKLEKKKKTVHKVKVKPKKKERVKKWYEKFHWFRLPDGRLVIGGRDAVTNEIIIKKHTQPHDLVFHTEMPGSPFFVIKTKGEEVSKEMREAVAQATASYSRGWRKRLGMVEAYCVDPEQVSKEAPSGEYLGRGAFMIRGKREWFKPRLRMSLAWDGERVIAGPPAVTKPQAEKIIVIEPGYTKPSVIAKKAQKWFEGGNLDELIRFLPAGKSDIIESKKIK